MIKQTIKDELIFLSIEKVDFSYRIPVKKIGNTTDWKIGVKESPGIVIKGVSIWALQLFTKNVTDDAYIQQFKDITQEQSPDNTIDWEKTLTALQIQNEYNSLRSEKKMNEDEIISELTTKYTLD